MPDLCVENRPDTRPCREETMATSKDGVFAVGVIVSPAGTVISHMGQGKQEAGAIYVYLTGETREETPR